MTENEQRRSTELPSHASPIISPVPRASSQYLQNVGWSELDRSSRASTPGIPDNLISPAFTPPLTPNAGTPLPHDEQLRRHLNAEPHSTPVDTSKDDLTTTRQPKLLQRLPKVECVVRARIPTTSGAEMFLHLYQNDVDNKEHLAIVFGNSIRSRSLDAERPGETEMDRMIRGAYVGRLRPGRISSRIDDGSTRPKRPIDTRHRSGSALKIVTNSSTIPENVVSDTTSSPSQSQLREGQKGQTHNQDKNHENDSIQSQLQSHQPSIINTAIPESPAENNPSESEADTTTTQDSSSYTSILKPPMVRIHSECYTGETAWSARCDCGEQLDEAARLMSLPLSSDPTQYTGGVIVYLRQEGRGIGLASKLKAYNLQDLGNDTVEANLLLRHPADARSYGLATAILQDLGLGTDSDTSKPTNERGIRLLTNNPDKVRAVEGPAREVRVVERVAMVPIAWKTGGIRGVRGVEIEKYLETKIGRMGHMLEK